MNLFAYGTLMDQEIMEQVSGSTYRSQKATLSQYDLKTVWGEVYPAILKRSGCSVNGIVYFDVSAEAFDRLDRFEGALYVRKKVLVTSDNDESVGAFTYVISPTAVNQLSDDNWSYESFLKNDKQLFQQSHPGFSKLGKNKMR